MSLDNVPYMLHGACMDWAFAIERHREPLLRIVVGLFAMIGLTENGAIERLSRPLYRLVLGILRPAESAVRRLIIVAARDIVVEPRPKRPFPTGRVIARKGKGQSKRGASFKLFDPRKRNDGVYGRRHKGRKSNPVFMSSISIPEFPCFSVNSPLPQRRLPLPILRRMTPSMPGLSAAVSSQSCARWKTCRARPSVSPAGVHGPSKSDARN